MLSRVVGSPNVDSDLLCGANTGRYAVGQHRATWHGRSAAITAVALRTSSARAAGSRRLRFGAGAGVVVIGRLLRAVDSLFYVFQLSPRAGKF